LSEQDDNTVSMNKVKVKLPYSDIEVEQLPDGQPVSEATNFLQETIIANTPRNSLTGLELGSGNGVVSLMLALQKPYWQLTGIELQRELVELSQSNNQKLGLKVRFLPGDLREYQQLLIHEGYDLIYANPPWIKASCGQISPNPTRALSRQEITCTMKDILRCVDWCLDLKGFGWIIYPIERKAELAREIVQTELEVCNVFETELSPRSFIAKLRKKAGKEIW
jgi:tRNA1(Val) A37 N6-methylase TrmN6